MNIAADGLENQTGDAYRLNLTRHGLNLYRRWRAKNRNQVLYTLPADLVPMLRASRLRFRLHVDRIGRRLALFLNDSHLTTVPDPFDPAPTGGFIQFYSYGAGEVRLSRVLCREWDGVLPVWEEPEEIGVNDLLLLDNRDVLTGKVVGIDETIVRFAADYGELEIPASRPRRLVFGGDSPPTEEATLATGEAFVLMIDGSRARLAVDSMTDELVGGHSSAVGRVAIARSAVRGIWWGPESQVP
jgi:hypothetical protein